MPAPKHHMLREIFEQPAAVQKTAEAARSAIASESFYGVSWKDACLRSLERILIAASGTSRHAGIAGKFMIESLAGIPVEVDYASEFQLSPAVVSPKTLTIVITQSGETADTLAALRKAKKSGSKVVTISNVADSSMMKEADFRIHTKAGPELAVPSTKAFTAQLTALFCFALFLAEVRKRVAKSSASAFRSELDALPGKLEAVLGLDAKCEALAQRFRGRSGFIFAARGVHNAVAMDGALKLKEVSYLHSEAFPSGEILHGPLATIDEDMTVVAIATVDSGDGDSKARYDKTLANLKELKGRSGKIVALASEGDARVTKITDEVLYIPKAPDLLLPILEIVPLQLFAYHIAVLLGRNVDNPRSLAKAVVND
ncbi:MAG: isomerizing glutamine--fructose-6-phosphate transaminase [Terriglobales bacterium]